MSPIAILPEIQTLADLLDRLGGIPLDRIRFHPAPGLAVEADVVEAEERDNRLCELIDGVLVEKHAGFRESILAVALASLLSQHVRHGNLGFVSGTDGMMRLFPGLVRIPDAAFVSWGSIPGGRLPAEPVPDLVPDLAVEVLSSSNTPREIQRKLEEYFDSGVKLVWIVDPEPRTVAVYTAPGEFRLFQSSESITGGSVLPGFVLSLADLFSELDRRAP